MPAIPAGARDLPAKSPALPLAGQPKIRPRTTGFRFFCLVGRILGMHSNSHLRRPFSAKCLKKWYLLAAEQPWRVSGPLNLLGFQALVFQENLPPIAYSRLYHGF
jgi:hypothetical protein